MKKIIYTCITGNYDDHIEQKSFKDWEYKAFCLRGDVWRAREVKLKPFEFFDYDVCLWVDGNIEILDNPDWLLCDDFVTMEHPDRDCVYDEAQACKFWHKDRDEIIDAQVNDYRELRYPAHNGMVATGVIMRKNTQENSDFCAKWWEELNKHSYRDQLSFNYVAWKEDLRYSVFNFLEGFRIHDHKN